MRRFVLRLWHVFRRDPAEQSLAREIASHLALLEDDFQRRGLSPVEARRAARLALGGVEQLKDHHRDARSFVWIDDLRRDVVLAVRLIRRNPLFALTAVLSLAIGIGANTAIFTVANALLFRPPVGVAEPSRLVDIGTLRPDGGLNPTSYLNYVDIGRRATLLNGVYAQGLFPHAVAYDAPGEAGAEVQHAYGHFVTTSYFAVLGATPFAGRVFDAHDSTQAGASPVVVLSHRFWTRRFGGDPAIVGRTLRVNGQPFTVIGVAAPDFQGTSLMASDLWLPLNMIGASNESASALTDRSGATMLIGARLASGASIEQAAAEIDAISHALNREFPPVGTPRDLGLLPSSHVLGNGWMVGLFFTFLMVIVGLVLIVACANVASILLARATARRREIAVRLAIGAGRTRLIRQLLTETLTLFAIGGVSGVLVGRGIIAACVPLLPPLPFPITVNLSLDGRVIAFTIVVSLVAALFSGLAPALQASRTDVLTALNGDQQSLWSIRGAGRSRLRELFVLAQVACSVLLVIVGGLFVRALQEAGAGNPGFQGHDVELATIDLSMAHYTAATAPPFLRDLTERLRLRPGIQEVTIASVVPGGFESIRLSGVTVPGFAPTDGRRVLYPSWNVVEPGYFSTLRIPLIAGRDFDDAQDVAKGQRVVIVSQSLARRFWPNDTAVGKYLSPDGNLAGTTPMLVIGVAGDIKSNTLIDGRTEHFVYAPMQQRYGAGPPPVTIVARRASARSVGDEIRAVVRSMDPNIPIISLQRLDDSTSLGLVLPRIVASVAGGLGSIGMLLAAIGIYGVTAFTVARRSREIGIRVALGARRREVVMLVLTQTMWVAGIGSAIGLGLAALVGRVLADFLFGVPPLDPPTFIGAAVLFAAIVGLASYVPVRRATRLHPLAVLRQD